MYIKKSNYKFHPKYTTKEKEEIALLYINNEMGATQIVKEFNLANNNVLYRWVKQYEEFGKIFETRGKATKFNNPNKVRPRKFSEKPLEELSKEELIERVRMLEDIKKSLVYLTSQQPNKNTK